ncbi:hypothetical protein HDU84_004460 [Entophlyctis sp. JEL0112]|nr:hypothetical protein HDU84_004460 [Entophlyctis sp. JEL0112]
MSKERDQRIRELEELLAQKLPIPETEAPPPAAPPPPSHQPSRLFSQTSAVSVSKTPSSASKNAAIDRNSLVYRQSISENRDTEGDDGRSMENGLPSRYAKNNQRPKSVSLSSAAQKPVASSWVPLVSKDLKGKPKKYAQNAVPATDKALIQIIEEERSKYNALEITYQTLLSEVKALQSAHINEIRAAEKRAEGAVSKANQTALEKSDELQAMAQEMKRQQLRFENLSKSREAESSRFEFQHSRLSAQVKEAKDKCEVLEQLVEELKGAKRDLSEKLEKRESEMKRLIVMYKERENDLAADRESRMKLELQIMRLDQTVEQKDNEIRSLKEQLKLKSAGANEAIKLKEALDQACREIEQLTSRENMYLQEIESASLRERQLFTKLEELNSSYQGAVNDIDRLHAKEAAKSKELDALRQNEGKLKIELNSAYQSNNIQAEEITAMQRDLQQSQNERSALKREVSDLRTHSNELSSQIKSKTDEISSLRDAELQLRKEIQNLKSELFKSQDDYSSLQSQLLDVANRLEMEVQSKSDIRQESKAKISSITEKIHEMQKALAGTQVQLEHAQQNEKILRATLQQRDVSIEKQLQQIKQYELKIADLQESLGKDEIVIETFKAKKKEDLIIVQEKFMAARLMMEEEVANLKAQLSSKISQASALSEDVSKMETEIQELRTDKFKLEMKLTELSSSESTLTRNISALQQQLRLREQELHVMGIKQQSLVDQLRVLEEELQSHRELNLRKEGEIQRMQNNMTEMNRKLREQVGVFLERSEVDGPALPSSPLVFHSRPKMTLKQQSFPSARTAVGIQSSGFDQKSITGMEDLDADFRQFIQNRNDTLKQENAFLTRPADGILATDELLK